MDKAKYSIGDQFILTITAMAEHKDTGKPLYMCDQFNDYPMLEESELDRLIPVTNDTLCYTNGFRVGYRAGYEDALKSMENWTQKIICVQKSREELLDKDIDDCGLTVRASNVLKNMGIWTVRGLVEHTEHEMMNTRYMGKKSYSEIKLFMKENGLRFKEAVND